MTPGLISSNNLRETVLQFGAGRFLRAFVDRFIQNANDLGQAVGRVVVVQSTPGQRADLLNSQPDGYHVLVRGLAEGETVDRAGMGHIDYRPIASALEAIGYDRFASAEALPYPDPEAAARQTNHRVVPQIFSPVEQVSNLFRIKYERYRREGPFPFSTGCEDGFPPVPNQAR